MRHGMAMSCRSRSSAPVREEKPWKELRRSCDWDTFVGNKLDMVPSGRPIDVIGDSSSSNGASSYGKSFGAEHEFEIGSISVFLWLIGNLSGEEMVLTALSLRSSGKANSVAPPSHLIQSSHSSISISAWKAFSKTLFSGLAKPLGVINFTSPFGSRRYKFLVGIGGSKFGVKGHVVSRRDGFRENFISRQAQFDTTRVWNFNGKRLFLSMRDGGSGDEAEIGQLKCSKRCTCTHFPKTESTQLVEDKSHGP